MSKLTPRQIEIERMIGEGLAPERIAGELKTSTAAVRMTLSRIFKKRGVSSTHELCAWYWKRKTLHI